MKRILSIIAIVAVVFTMASCVSNGPVAHGGGHSTCGAYGNP